MNMDLKELLFSRCRDAVEHYTASVKSSGETDTKTKEALAAFKALYGLISGAELEADYQVWREKERRDKHAGQSGQPTAS